MTPDLIRSARKNQDKKALKEITREVDKHHKYYDVIRHSQGIEQIPEKMDRILKHLTPELSSSEIMKLSEAVSRLNAEAVQSIQSEMSKGSGQQQDRLAENLQHLQDQSKALNDLHAATQIITGNFLAFHRTAGENFETLDTWVSHKQQSNEQVEYYYQKVRKGVNVLQGAPQVAGNMLLGISLWSVDTPKPKSYTFSKNPDELREIDPFDHKMPVDVAKEQATNAIQRYQESTKAQHAEAQTPGKSPSAETTNQSGSADNHTATLRRRESVASIMSVDVMQERPASYLSAELKKELDDDLVKVVAEIKSLREKQKETSSFNVFSKLWNKRNRGKLATEANLLSHLTEDPVQRAKTVQDLPELHHHKKNLQKAESNAQAHEYRRALRTIGKYFVSSTYKTVWDNTKSTKLVTNIVDTHKDVMDQLVSMHKYTQDVEKNIWSDKKAPDIQKIQHAIGSHQKAAQSFTRRVADNLDTVQKALNTFISDAEKQRTLGIVQTGYESIRSLGNVSQAEGANVARAMVTRVLGALVPALP